MNKDVIIINYYYEQSVMQHWSSSSLYVLRDYDTRYRPTLFFLCIAKRSSLFKSWWHTKKICRYDREKKLTWIHCHTDTDYKNKQNILSTSWWSDGSILLAWWHKLDKVYITLHLHTFLKVQLSIKHRVWFCSFWSLHTTFTTSNKTIQDSAV